MREGYAQNPWRDKANAGMEEGVAASAGAKGQETPIFPSDERTVTAPAGGAM